LAQLGGSLVDGMIVLLDQHNIYAAAALLRQLVEIEYLGQLFATDIDLAAQWVRATADERQAGWQPRHIRQRLGGDFRSRHYKSHCNLGGHPMPDLPGLFFNCGNYDSAGHWIELANHGTYLWVAMDGCGRALGYGSLFDSVNDRLEIETHIAIWWESDALAHALLDAVASASQRREGQPASK
jgi:hypothetical protein